MFWEKNDDLNSKSKKYPNFTLLQPYKESFFIRILKDL